MEQGISIAFIGVLGTLAGVIGTLLTTRWRLEQESRGHKRDQLIDFYKTELEYAREECRRWQERSERWETVARENLSGMETATETLKHMNTTGGP